MKPTDNPTRIMVVDDEHDLTKVMKIALEEEGFSVDAFNSAKEALSKYEPSRYGLILLDIRMPEMNGFDLFREVKRKDSNAKICFLTAFDVYAGEFQKLFPNMKVEGFLTKPISISHLASEIRKITG
jgi:two-component system catabolic regulation response regulator CreB/two-component system response regulator ChvI